MAEHINKTDTLNEGRVKLNEAISDAETAKVTAEGADVKSTQALANSESTQTQLDTIVIEGDSSVEAAQARVDEKGESHATLKARIDDGFEKTSSQLAEKANHANVTSQLNQKADKNKVDMLETNKADKADLEVEVERINNLVAHAGDTDGNAELLDIRTGWDGTIYPTAGEAVRAIGEFLTTENEEWEMV